MEDYLRSSIALGAVGLFFVVCCSAPAVKSLFDRFRPSKGKANQYNYIGLYEDEDGKATEESQRNFSTTIPRTLALITVIVGFLISLTYSVLATVGVITAANIESWLQTGSWAVLVAQSISVWIDPSPTRRYRQGVWAAWSSLIIALCLVLTNIYTRDYEYPDEVMVSLLATQMCLLLLAIAAFVSIQRRPQVYYEGRLVDSQMTASFISMLTFSWPNFLIDISQKRKLEYEDLPFLAKIWRTESLSDRYSKARKFNKLWKTIVVNFRWAFAKQWSLTTFMSFVEFVPQIAMLNLLRILEQRDEQPLPGVIWLWVAILGIAMLVVTQTSAQLFFITW